MRVEGREWGRWKLFECTFRMRKTSACRTSGDSLAQRGKGALRRQSLDEDRKEWAQGARADWPVVGGGGGLGKAAGVRSFAYFVGDVRVPS